MDIWQEHAKRDRRRAQFEAFDRWCLHHPGKARLLSLAIALILFGLYEFLSFIAR